MHIRSGLLTDVSIQFVIVIYGAGNGNLGVECNRHHSDVCGAVYRARSTAFATLTFQILFFVSLASSF